MITPSRKLQCHYRSIAKNLWNSFCSWSSQECCWSVQSRDFLPLTAQQQLFCCFHRQNENKMDAVNIFWCWGRNGFWVIGILLYCVHPCYGISSRTEGNVFWREFSQACEYYLLARGISSENLLFQQLLKKLPCLQGHQLSKPTVLFYVFLRCLLRQIIEELRI